MNNNFEKHQIMNHNLRSQNYFLAPSAGISHCSRISKDILLPKCGMLYLMKLKALRTQGRWKLFYGVGFE